MMKEIHCLSLMINRYFYFFIQMNYDVKEGFLTCTGIGHKILFDSQ
jgi:hypothetical protein